MDGTSFDEEGVELLGSGFGEGFPGAESGSGEELADDGGDAFDHG